MDCTVLIVEDDDDLREMLARFLDVQGARPVTARNGQEALDILGNQPRPDVILLDLIMPVMDGWSFLRRQQSQATIADIPVVIVSAVADRAGDLARAAAIVPKPADPDALLATIRAQCRPPR